jgi:hypothetical protein
MPRQPQGQGRQNPNDNKADQIGYFRHQARIEQIGRTPVRLDDPEQVRGRFDTFLATCAESGVKPTVPGLALALGVSVGELAASGSAEVSRCRRVIEDITAQMLMDGRIPQAPGIFLLKNWFGYRDASEVSLLSERASSTPEEIALRYANVELVDDGGETRGRGGRGRRGRRALPDKPGSEG